MNFSQLGLEQCRKNAARGRAKIMENRQKRRERWRAEARVLWEQWRCDSFFLLGIGLYWGEGRKTLRMPVLSLSNSDVKLLRVWLRWCQRFLPDVPLYCFLGIHDSCDVEAARDFWRSELGIEVKAVCVAVSSASKRKRNTLPHGTLTIRVGRGGVEWFTKMLVWLELAQDL
jgi:hypothetical protein